MPRQTCSVCKHPERADIEKAITSGTPSLRDLAQQCGLGLTSLFRHKQHMAVAKDSSMKNIPEEIRKLRIMLAKAKRKGDTSSALSISREIRAWLAFEAKTRPIHQDKTITDEIPVRDAVALAKSVIESQLDDPDVQAWLAGLTERVSGAPVPVDEDEFSRRRSNLRTRPSGNGPDAQE
jgi:hypothetical protein